MKLERLLEEMVMVPALSGYEQPMAAFMCQSLETHADEVRRDSLGNVLATIGGGDAAAPRIMVFAHMDQLGFLVRRIEADGLIRIERLGGIPEKVLPATRVWVQPEEGGTVPGVIGVKAHHATPPEEKHRVTPYTDLFVDVGAKSASEVRREGIEVGCPIVYQPHFTRLLGKRIAATSIDDRAGCAVLVKIAEAVSRNRIDATLHLVGSVQEEFNLRGAMVAASTLKPDLAIAIDLVVAADTPDLETHSELRLGGGPVLCKYSFHGRGTLNGTIPHPALVRLFRDTAVREAIAIQRSANLGSLTDSSYVQLVDGGIPCIDLGFAARYTHSPVETCDLGDLESLLAWLVAGLRSITSDFSLDRGQV
jgi:putative aminopeptidase FrvX